MTYRNAAHARIMELKEQYNLGFLFNPGGGQFTCRDSSSPLYGFNCQVFTDGDPDEEILKTLETAINKALGK